MEVASRQLFCLLPPRQAGYRISRVATELSYCSEIAMICKWLVHGPSRYR